MSIHKLENLAASSTNKLFIQKEYLCLPNFLIACSDVIEESEDCTTFSVYKVYGWDEFSQTCSLILLDTHGNPTVGVWQQDSLTVYQDTCPGYLRLSYSVMAEKTSERQTFSGNSKRYKFFADVSENGSAWHRLSTGEYGCS